MTRCRAGVPPTGSFLTSRRGSTGFWHQMEILSDGHVHPSVDHVRSAQACHFARGRGRRQFVYRDAESAGRTSAGAVMNDTKCSELKAEFDGAAGAAACFPSLGSSTATMTSLQCGCNLLEHPGIGVHFRELLTGLLRRPDVGGSVRADLIRVKDPGDGCWPFTDTDLHRRHDHAGRTCAAFWAPLGA